MTAIYCKWQVPDVGDRFEMYLKSRVDYNSVTNIFKLSPSSLSIIIVNVDDANFRVWIVSNGRGADNPGIDPRICKISKNFSIFVGYFMKTFRKKVKTNVSIFYKFSDLSRSPANTSSLLNMKNRLVHVSVQKIDSPRFLNSHHSVDTCRYHLSTNLIKLFLAI